jgi:hypothetical protein
LRHIVMIIFTVWEGAKSAIIAMYWRISDWYYRRQVSG